MKHLQQIQRKLAVIQQELQKLKSQIDQENSDHFSEEEQALVDKVSFSALCCVLMLLWASTIIFIARPVEDTF